MPVALVEIVSRPRSAGRACLGVVANGVGIPLKADAGSSGAPSPDAG